MGQKEKQEARANKMTETLKQHWAEQQLAKQVKEKGPDGEWRYTATARKLRNQAKRRRKKYA